MRFFLFTSLFLVIFVSNSYAEQLKIFGCGIVRDNFVTKLGDAFAKKYNVNVEFSPRGSDVKVLKTLKEGGVDIGAGCRTSFKSGDEKDIWSIQVAWGALVFIVNENNPVDNISIKQARDILKGNIRNWKELGGQDAEINVYVRKEKISGVGFSARVQLFHNPKEDFFSGVIKKPTSFPIRKAVASDLYGFAIDDVTSYHVIEGLKVLKVDNIYPYKENILSKRYTLARPFYLYSNGRPTGIKRDFIKFVMSKDGQKIISDLGLVSLKEGRGAANLNYLFQLLGV